MDIRQSSSADLDEIVAVHDDAFGTTGEGRLARRLIEDGLAIASILALDPNSGIATGHALFSRLECQTKTQPIRAAALAPVGVRHGWQRLGVGQGIVAAGLEVCRVHGFDAVFVVGSPAYYERFGFSTIRGALIDSPYSGPAFMALELNIGCLDSGGLAVYPNAFSLVD